MEYYLISMSFSTYSPVDDDSMHVSPFNAVVLGVNGYDDNDLCLPPTSHSTSAKVTYSYMSSHTTL